MLAIALALATSALADPGSYQQPPEPVLRVLHAPAPPNVFTSPARDAFLLAAPVRYPPIAWLAQPMLKLAGARLNPRTHAPHDPSYWSQYVLVRVSDGAQQQVATPPGAKLGAPVWSADGKRFAFELYAADAVELWLCETATARARKVAGVRLNPVLDRHHLQWLPDQKTLLVKLVPKAQVTPPPEPAAPVGPEVQEASGAKGPTSTYEKRDALRGPRDEALFEFFGLSQLALVDAARGTVTPLGRPGLYTTLEPAPDGVHLLVQSLHRPFSYLTTYGRFPTEVEVWNRSGQVLHTVASLPLADDVPIQGVPVGPRSFSWRPTEPATLVWAEALDGGDWKAKVPHRDRVMLARAPFDQPPVKVLETEQRFGGLWWTEQGPVFLSEYDLIRHWTRTWLVDVDGPAAPRLVWDRSSDDRYKHPGDPLFRVLPNGFPVVQQDAEAIFLRGAGASPAGDRPFLDRLELRTLKAERLFRTDQRSYELVLDWVDLKAGQFLTRRESPTEVPNYFVRTLGPAVAAAEGAPTRASTARQVTRFTDPTPELRGITKQIVRYQRADGLDLSFTLYLPPGAKPGARLPTVVWAYPLDFADAQSAGQVAGSAQRFTVLGWPLQLFFLLDGYAVIDNPSMPVIGDTMKIYDTYLEQLVAGAKAAVSKAVELGVTDPDRVGVIGHSHGGLMTANLLAHSDLFRAGIARSGAYNRSLTAFGFQNERRTWWEAPQVYLQVSPFFAADKIKAPLLLIHGAADQNPGTEPVQSEKLYEAIRGNGGTVRLVMLPLEAHGYSALESTEHVLAESLRWFDRYVKHAPPRPAAAKDGGTR